MTLLSDITATTTAPRTSTVTTVNLTGSSAVLLASNPLRKKWSFVNTGNAVAYVVCNNSAASATNYSYVIPAGAMYESYMNDYTGEIRILGTNGTAIVTEYV
jgi:hypothetical protein